MWRRDAIGKQQDDTGDIMSAMVEVAHRVRGLKLGAIDYICKPFDIQDLQDRVRTHLRLQQLERLKRQRQQEKIALEVLSAAAHELAQPLSGALGQVQLMQLMLHSVSTSNLLNRPHISGDTVK